jgi:23S rRNA (adenine2503-C2)-methyltransferase
MVRTTRGDDIAAARGPLAGEVNDRTKRQARYKKRLNEIQPLNIME